MDIKYPPVRGDLVMNRSWQEQLEQPQALSFPLITLPFACKEKASSSAWPRSLLWCPFGEAPCLQTAMDVSLHSNFRLWAADSQDLWQTFLPTPNIRKSSPQPDLNAP